MNHEGHRASVRQGQQESHNFNGSWTTSAGDIITSRTSSQKALYDGLPREEWIRLTLYGKPAPAVEKSGLAGRLLGSLASLMVAAAIALGTQAALAKPYEIPSGSMLPTIQLNDRVIANRFIYRFAAVERGDVVVFQPPESLDQGIPWIKRVIGVPGDTVEVRDGKVLVNGSAFDIPVATKPNYTMPAKTVPEGSLFVLGDNRNDSYDSHLWGFVPAENVIGRAELIYWPLDHLGLLGG